MKMHYYTWKQYIQNGGEDPDRFWGLIQVTACVGPECLQII
jgi:hypothetical protein